MSKEIKIAIRRQEYFIPFLTLNGFSVEDLGDGNFYVQREKELPVLINVTDNNMRFQVDVCHYSSIDTKESLFKFLDLNTEIIPVSFGIDSTDKNDPRLVLVESRQIDDLNDSELLGVFDALELALDRAEKELEIILKNQGV